MSTRFSDDITNNASGSDFVVRKWRLSTLQLLTLFGITFVAIYLTATVMYDIGNQNVFFITFTIIFSLLSWITITYAARNRDLVMATEFQNALLASAAQLSTRFCFITRTDGSIVYTDPGFQQLFQAFMHKGGANVEGLLIYAEASEELKQKTNEVLREGKNERLQLALRAADGRPMPMVVTIDVLPRPKGYFLFRGRDYIEKRTTENEKQLAENAATDTTSAVLLSHALRGLTEGILITDRNGVITYINRALEEWLGFGPGEILASPMKLEQICHQYGGDGDIGKVRLDNFEGSITLQRKNHTLLPLRIRQTLVQDSGNVLGISAILSQPGNTI